MVITKGLLSAKLRAPLVRQPHNSLPLQILVCKYGHNTYHRFWGKGGYLKVLEGTLDVWAENIFFEKSLQEDQSKCLLLLPLQDICPLAIRGLLHQAEWRAAPTMTQTDSLHLMATFAAFYSNSREVTHVKKHLLPADFSSLQCFCNRTALVDGMRKESTVLHILRNITIVLFFL